MLNQKSIDLIKSFEGCHLACYHLGDGVCTIGYGHTRPLAQCSCAGAWKISQEQAEGFLQNDLAKYRNAVMGYFTRDLNENQIGALTSFCYNLGTGIFAQYNFPKNGSDSAITSQMMLFLNKGTPFEAGITRRRQAETALFLAKEITNQNNVTTNTPKESKEEKEMKIITITTDGSYYGKNYKAGACFYFTGDSIRYIERPATLEAFNILGIPYHKLNAIQFLYLIQDLDLKII